MRLLSAVYFIFWTFSENRVLDPWRADHFVTGMQQPSAGG
jgi:hypothetical protein